MVKKPYEFIDSSSQKERELELEEREEKERSKIFKTCLKCGERKSLLYFAKDKRYRSGRMGICKTCRAKESLRYYYENKEKILIKIKEYQDTRDRSKYFESYKIDHKEHLQKIASKWYKKNRKRIKKRNLERKAKKFIVQIE